MNSDKRIFFLLLLLLLTCSLVAIAQEQITLTTYYPAPFGEYQNVRLVPTTGATSGTSCTATQTGLMFYNSTTNEILYCNGGSSTWAVLGGGGGGGGSSLWTLSGSNLYPTTLSSNVGIGTTDPVYKLNVAGTALVKSDTFSGDALIVGNDTKLVDIDIANTMGLYGIPDATQGHIKLGSSGPTISGVNGNVGIGTSSPGNVKLNVNAPYATDWNYGILSTANRANTKALAVNNAGIDQFVVYGDGYVGIGIGGIKPSARLTIGGALTTPMLFAQQSGFSNPPVPSDPLSIMVQGGDIGMMGSGAYRGWNIRFYNAANTDYGNALVYVWSPNGTPCATRCAQIGRGCLFSEDASGNFNIGGCLSMWGSGEHCICL
ncbi:MAG: hypothetical protein HY590_00625 [Candidatus Omnitrophica bacterium]|nr:hypothetical protein [Candidatus Omnitrophota bacterium]